MRRACPMNRRFDAIIIGTGQAGPSMAARLTAAGMTVAIVERHLVGGTCINTGCTPTKTLVASAYAAHLARRGADFGVMTGDVRIDMARVHARSQQIATDGAHRQRNLAAGDAALHPADGSRPVRSPARGPRRRRRARSRAHLHQCRRPSDRFPTCQASMTCPVSPTVRCWRRISCPSIWSSSAAAISGWNSPRSTAVSDQT